MNMVRRIAITTLVPSLLALSAQSAWGADADSDQWRWTLTPYLWLPTINAKMRFEIPRDDPGGGTSVDSEVGPSDYLTDLNGVLMLAAELRQGDWAFLGDLVWLDLTTDVSRVKTVSGEGGTISIPRETNLDTETQFSGFVVNLIASHVLSDGEAGRIEALGGARYFTLDADLDWQLTSTITGPGFTFGSEGRLSGDIDMWDAVVGMRGRWQFGTGGHWYVPWYVDVGTGSSDLTWQAMAGIGYTFERTSIRGVWRHLDYERDNSDLLQEISFGGPGIGVSWRF
jgi:hypothetical protein